MEQQKILNIVTKYQQLVHHPDSDLLNELFTKDATLISITTEYKGINIYNGFLINKLSELYSSIVLINDGIDIRMVNENLAIVIFKYHTECIRRETDESYGIEGLETQVLIKEDNHWKITHIHYSK